MGSFPSSRPLLVDTTHSTRNSRNFWELAEAGRTLQGPLQEKLSL